MSAHETLVGRKPLLSGFRDTLASGMCGVYQVYGFYLPFVCIVSSIVAEAHFLKQTFLVAEAWFPKHSFRSIVAEA